MFVANAVDRCQNVVVRSVRADAIGVDPRLTERTLLARDIGHPFNDGIDESEIHFVRGVLNTVQVPRKIALSFMLRPCPGQVHLITDGPVVLSVKALRVVGESPYMTKVGDAHGWSECIAARKTRDSVDTSDISPVEIGITFPVDGSDGV